MTTSAAPAGVSSIRWPFPSGPLFRYIASFVVLLALTLSAHATPVEFNIPAQPAHKALQAFVKQSGTEVLYMQDDLAKVQSAEVKGSYEPAGALATLLTGTGFTAQKTGEKNFVIKKDVGTETGSIKGSLVGEGGRPLADVLVTIREITQSTTSDSFGRFSFSSVKPGTYTLVATTTGYQPMHITDVQVRAGRDLTLGKEEMRKALGDTTALEPFVVHADAVQELEKFEVTGARTRPFADANVDLPRTIDDVQPYYIIDGKRLEQSGALTVDDFLRNRVTMNTQAMSQAQRLLDASSTSSTISSAAINLRGLGTNETLILVNGRRMVGVSNAYLATRPGGSSGQPDINGIPMSAIDRIEILPSSAGAIYGASALGGVVNVILKRNYRGGEIKATYFSTWDGNAPQRTYSVTAGAALEGGKTHLLVTGQYNDSEPLIVGDRVELLQRGFQRIRNTFPAFVALSAGPLPLGKAVNFASYDGGGLTYKTSGLAASANFGYANAGATSVPSNPVVGSFDFTPPLTNQSPTGLLYPLGNFPRNKSLTASLTRQMTKNVEFFAEGIFSDNRAFATVNPHSGALASTVIAASNPYNPFNQPIQVNIPWTYYLPQQSRSKTQSLTLGIVAQLPADWTAEFDYTHSKNTNYQTNSSKDPVNEFAPDSFNPFADYSTNATGLLGVLTGFDVDTVARGASSLDDYYLRAAGPLSVVRFLPVSLALGVEHREEQRLSQGVKSSFSDPNFVTAHPEYAGLVSETIYLPQSQSTDSLYTEFTVPVVSKKNEFRFLKTLEFQLSNRLERFRVDAGTDRLTRTYAATPVTETYTPNVGGRPFNSTASYAHDSQTFGFKVQPIVDLTFRASIGTGFLPPTYAQLLRNPTLSNPVTSSGGLILDPKNGRTYNGYRTLSGGNPDIKPQHSKSANLGVIYEPSQSALRGLRFNLEYYKIQQFDYITTLTAQQIVNDDSFANRIVRDPSTGLITQIDLSNINATEFTTEGYDGHVSYRRSVGGGELTFDTGLTYIESEKRQLSRNTPLLDYAGFVASGGEAKLKSNATLTWQSTRLGAGWTVNYFGTYRQARADGDPLNYSTTTKSTATRDFQYLQAQGASSIASQIYHDAFLSWTFPEGRGHPDSSRARRYAGALLQNVTILLNVRNVFGTVPPFDAFYGPFYMSPYGSYYLRTYSVSLKKTF